MQRGSGKPIQGWLSLTNVEMN